MRAQTLFLAAFFALTSPAALAQLPAFGEVRGWATTEKTAPLPEEQAFKVEGIADGSSLLIRLTPEQGYYLYRHTFEVTPLSEKTTLGKLESANGEDHEDPHFGLVQIYRTPAELIVPVTTSPSKQVQVSVAFQGCQSEGICYPPMSRLLDIQLETLPTGPASHLEDAVSSAEPENAVEVPLAAQTNSSATSPVAEDERLAGVLEDRPAWQALAVFFGLGLLLGLTPCVLPMVPVLLGLVAGSKTSTRQTLGLASTYVLAHALVFALLGATAAWMGGGLQALFQQGWVLIPMAILIASLGSILLAGGTLQMPTSVQRWAGNRGQGGSLAGAAAMGALSSLIIGPCVAPPLAGAVLYLAQSGNPWLGASALFALGLGMGGPMLVAAAGMGKWLPKTGPWADHLSRVFGIGFLVLAAWLASRLWTAPQALLLAVTGALAAGMWVWHKQPSQRPWSLGTAMMAMLVLGWSIGQMGSNTPKETQESASVFTKIQTERELDQQISEASKAGKTVILDYYADWCTACIDMEKRTFSDRQVQDRLLSQDVVALKVDVTSNSSEARALMKRYGIVGPPATLFIQQNQETRPARLIGFESSQQFLSRVNALPRVEPLQCQPPTHLANHEQVAGKEKHC